MYGHAATTALFALTAFIEGFPLVLQELEDGRFEAVRRILRIRRAVPELMRGTGDYECVEAPDGVFACLREGGDGASVASSVTVRNGGKVFSIDGGSLVNNGTLTTDDPGWYAMAFDGDGEISGGAAGTCAIAVRSGTTVVYDSDQDNKFWRLVLRDTPADTTTLNVIEKSGGSSTVVGTTNANVALQKFHLFPTASGKPGDDARINAMTSEAAAGTPALQLAAGQCVSAKPYLAAGTVLGYNSTETGTQITTQDLLAGGLGTLAQWQRNTVFANGALSEADASTWETLSMRLDDGAAAGTLSGWGVSVNGSPRSQFGVRITSAGSILLRAGGTVIVMR